MNVLQVSKYYYPEVGGLEQVVRAFAAGLNGPEYTMRVLAATPRGRGRTETIDGVRVRKAACLGELSSTPIAPLFPVELAAAGRTADVLHFHLPNPAAVVSQLSLGPAGVDSPTGTEPPSDTDRPPGFDLPIDPDRSTVLFVGRLSYYKGVEYLLDAMGGVDATLLVVGDGEQRAALERRTREREGVAFLGRVSDATLKRCYAAADVFVLPSVAPSEAFGIVQLEAMAHGTPIVNTALPTGVPWVSKDGKTGLTVPPKDADALADAIERLLANPDLRRQYGENARERVHRRFSRETMLDAMAAVYEDVTE